MPWKLRYASHLGYRSVDEPLFRETVSSLDPVAHIDYAAGLGFAGVQYALAVTRPADEHRRVGAALARHDLETGCMLWAGFDKIRLPLWGDGKPASRDFLVSELHACAEVAKRIRARHVAVLSAADPTLPLGIQQAHLIENLKWASAFAERENLVLCIESLSRRSLPGMLVHHITEAYAIVKAVDHPSVRMIFDTSHVQIMDGDLLEHLAATWDVVAIVQIADNPGRFEPGSGEINFRNVLRVLYERNYRGLVELEHLWSCPGADAERLLIEELRTIEGSFDASRTARTGTAL